MKHSRRRFFVFSALVVAGCSPDAPFREAGGEMGLPVEVGECLVFRDLDGDERPDLLLVTPVAGSEQVELALWRNEGTRFRRERVLATGLRQVFGCKVVDHDADGLADIILRASTVDGRVLLRLRGVGDGYFAKPDLFAPLRDVTRPVVLMDLDGDGEHELITSGSLRKRRLALSCETPDTDLRACATTPPVDQTNIVPGEILFSHGRQPMPPCFSNAFTLVDWDFDGVAEVFSSNDFSHNNLFDWHQGAVVDLLPSLGASYFNMAMGAAFADFDADGAWDVYVADLGGDELFFHERGRLVDRSTEWGVTEATELTSSWTPLAADFDLDGYTDVFIVGSGVAETPEGLVTLANNKPSRLDAWDTVLMNQAGAGFEATRVPHGWAGGLVVGGLAALADQNADGALDVAVIAPARDENVGRLRLLMGVPVPEHHWVGLRLTSTSALEQAVVRIFAGGRQVALVQAGTTGLGQSWPVVHAGLGTATAVDRVEVIWPDGEKQTITEGLEIDRINEVRQR